MREQFVSLEQNKSSLQTSTNIVFEVEQTQFWEH